MPVEISIIIPLYNKEKYIIETLTSVVNQTFVDWECLIIDDSSTDGSLDVVNAYLLTTKKLFKVISQKNSGQSVARNTGIFHSTGKYIAFLDADDIWATNKLAQQFSQLEASLSSVCSLTAYQIYDPLKRNKFYKLVKHTEGKRLIDEWTNLLGFGGGIESGGLVRKSALNLVGGFREDLSTSAGLELTVRLNSLGGILFSNGTYFRYRKYEGQWHTFENILTGNLQVLRDLIGGSKTRLAKQHEAYILFSRLRTMGLGKFLNNNLLDALKIAPYILHLGILILKRNLIASILGFVKAKKISKLFFD